VRKKDISGEGEEGAGVKGDEDEDAVPRGPVSTQSSHSGERGYDENTEKGWVGRRREERAKCVIFSA